MSVPIDSSVWVPGTVLLASLLGSAHCVGMCGGLVTSVCRSRVALLQYHFGRLIAYVGMGAIAGYFGKNLFGSADTPWLNGLSWLAVVTMAALFVVMGVRVWRGGALHFSIIPQKWLMSLYRVGGKIPFVMGGLSAFLPCGWLQSFVLAAAATRGPLAGGTLMAVFWLGTMPALSSLPWLVNRVLRPLSMRTPRICALLLILAGLSGLGFKMSPLLKAGVLGHGNASTPSCHHGEESE